MTATLSEGSGAPIDIGAELSFSADGLKGVKWIKAEHELRGEGPLVLGYGAGRHVGNRNRFAVAQRSPVSSLFAPAVDLFDAEEIIEQLELGTDKGSEESRKRDTRRLRTILDVVRHLLNEDEPPRIEFRGPRIPGRPTSQSGVHVSTPSGSVPLSSLSLGSQAVFAWIVDLSYRLVSAFPDSPNALRESAIVIVDEIDLHLHPRWQRTLRAQLLRFFPKIQFIASTHSPVTALEALANGGQVSVVHWHNDSATIVNDPLPAGAWTYDQLLTSQMFEFSSTRGLEAERLMTERVELVKVPRRTATQDRRLEELDGYVSRLPVSTRSGEKTLERLMEDYRRDRAGRSQA